MPLIRYADACDYCGVNGCHWTRHAQARADVAAYERTQQPGLDAEYAREHQPTERITR